MVAFQQEIILQKGEPAFAPQSLDELKVCSPWPPGQASCIEAEAPPFMGVNRERTKMF
jgi:hypothetical protein